MWIVGENKLSKYFSVCIFFTIDELLSLGNRSDIAGLSNFVFFRQPILNRYNLFSLLMHYAKLIINFNSAMNAHRRRHRLNMNYYSACSTAVASEIK